MTTLARPGTPFPHAHTMSHASSSSTSYPFSTQPLHFHLQPLPSPTPPSLLKRTGSSSSSRSLQLRSNTPPLSYRRESTTSTSSTSSPAMPATPLLSSLDPEIPELLLPLTPPPTPTYFDPSYCPPKFPSTWTSTDELTSTPRHATPPPPPPTPVQPIRPAFKRRDTPRPESPIIATLTQASEQRASQQRRYTSVIDGGSWLVLEEPRSA